MTETLREDKKVVAIEIDSPLTWAVLCDLEPHFKHLLESDNIGRYVLLNYGARWSIWTAEMLAKEFESATENVWTINLIRLTPKE